MGQCKNEKWQLFLHDTAIDTFEGLEEEMSPHSASRSDL